jgi:hypothetical protein
MADDFDRECPICMEPYDEVPHKPVKMMPCDHPICKSCVDGMITAAGCQTDDRGNISGGVFECPTCRRNVTKVRIDREKFDQLTRENLGQPRNPLFNPNTPANLRAAEERREEERRAKREAAAASSSLGGKRSRRSKRKNMKSKRSNKRRRTLNKKRRSVSRK